MQGWIIFAEIEASAGETALRDHFSKFGEILDLQLAHLASGKMSHVLVSYGTVDEAQAAVSHHHHPHDMIRLVTFAFEGKQEQPAESHLE